MIKLKLYIKLKQKIYFEPLPESNRSIQVKGFMTTMEETRNVTYEHLKFQAQLSLAWKKVI